jgi:hypothetical protein
MHILRAQFPAEVRLVDDTSISVMSPQVSQLQERIMSEDKSLAARTQDLVNEWNLNKPIQGNIKPSAALDVSSSLVLCRDYFLSVLS